MKILDNYSWTLQVLDQQAVQQTQGEDAQESETELEQPQA